MFFKTLLSMALLASTTSISYAVDIESDSQIRCLAENIYFEARGEPFRGRIAIANVVMNRSRDSRFPRTPCGVIMQRYRNVCQFSWVCNRQRIANHALMGTSRRIAEQVYYGEIADVTNGAKFFHNRSVRPSWSHKKRMTANIGNHLFYR